MNNSESSTEKEYTKEYLNNHDEKDIDLNSDTNDSCNINLGKTIYYFKKETKYNLLLDAPHFNYKKDIVFSPCDISQNNSVEIDNTCSSRLLIFNVKLKNVCPNKLLVFGVLVYENNNLYSFKAKKLSTLGLSYNKCKNIDAGKFSFLFYDNQPFKQKKLNIKFIYNYVMF